MTQQPQTGAFLTGVIEGFYGPPWTYAERVALFDWMAAWGLGTYYYAPKDDLKHRALWRELYSTAESDALRRILEACAARNLQFIYGLSPGLDIRYGRDADLEQVLRRFDQMLALGCRHVSLLFDDIPGALDREDGDRWPSLASAQCHVANTVFAWLRARAPGARLVFCPTAYCGRMAQAGLGGPGYLSILGRDLLPDIDVVWTGPDIVSREISVIHVQELRTVLRRKPIIWDNLHANDYDGRRFFCGPYSGRPPELRIEVNGLLSNPNCELPLNFVPLRTLSEFVRSTGSWDARQTYLSAMREWLPAFATVGRPIDLEDLILLSDCYYLPHEEGPEAVALFESARSLLARDPAEWGEEVAAFRDQARRLRDVCTRLTTLRDRPLFHALHRRVWELGEELDVLNRYVDQSLGALTSDAPVGAEGQIESTYRGGMVARLQRLLVPGPDGTFTPAWRAKGRRRG
jgi:protein O-GlcNAcase/histone acetyltransferase